MSFVADFSMDKEEFNMVANRLGAKRAEVKSARGTPRTTPTKRPLRLQTTFDVWGPEGSTDSSGGESKVAQANTPEQTTVTAKYKPPTVETKPVVTGAESKRTDGVQKPASAYETKQPGLAPAAVPNQTLKSLRRNLSREDFNDLDSTPPPGYSRSEAAWRLLLESTTRKAEEKLTIAQQFNNELTQLLQLTMRQLQEQKESDLERSIELRELRRQVKEKEERGEGARPAYAPEEKETEDDTESVGEEDTELEGEEGIRKAKVEVPAEREEWKPVSRQVQRKGPTKLKDINLIVQQWEHRIPEHVKQQDKFKLWTNLTVEIKRYGRSNGWPLDIIAEGAPRLTMAQVDKETDRQYWAREEMFKVLRGITHKAQRTPYEVVYEDAIDNNVQKLFHVMKTQWGTSHIEDEIKFASKELTDLSMAGESLNIAGYNSEFQRRLQTCSKLGIELPWNLVRSYYFAGLPSHDQKFDTVIREVKKMIKDNPEHQQDQETGKDSIDQVMKHMHAIAVEYKRDQWVPQRSKEAQEEDSQAQGKRNSKDARGQLSQTTDKPDKNDDGEKRSSNNSKACNKGKGCTRPTCKFDHPPGRQVPECATCKKTGHKTEWCGKCFQCGDPSHKRPDCPDNPKNAKGQIQQVKGLVTQLKALLGDNDHGDRIFNLCQQAKGRTDPSTDMLSVSVQGRPDLQEIDAALWSTEMLTSQENTSAENTTEARRKTGKLPSSRQWPTVQIKMRDVAPSLTTPKSSLVALQIPKHPGEKKAFFRETKVLVKRTRKVWKIRTLKNGRKKRLYRKPTSKAQRQKKRADAKFRDSRLPTNKAPCFFARKNGISNFKARGVVVAKRTVSAAYRHKAALMDQVRHASRVMSNLPPRPGRVVPSAQEWRLHTAKSECLKEVRLSRWRRAKLRYLEQLKGLQRFRTVLDVKVSLVALVTKGKNNSIGSAAVLDSGAAEHSSSEEGQGRLQHTVNLAEKDQIEVAGLLGPSTRVTQAGVLQIPGASKDIKINVGNVLKVPGASHTLLSVGKLADQGMRIFFGRKHAEVCNGRGEVIIYAERKDGIYRVVQAPPGFKPELGTGKRQISQLAQHIQKYSPDSLLTDHILCGHRNFTHVRALKNYPPASRTDPNPVCEACLAAQFREPQRPTEARTVAPQYNYRWCTDTSAKMPRAQFGSQKDLQRYFLSVDDYSGQMVPLFGMRKSDAVTRVVGHLDRQNNQNPTKKVAEHQSDSGKEYLNSTMEGELQKRGIKQRVSPPYCQWKNGVAESAMDYVQRTERAMRHQGNAPRSDWPYSVAEACYLYDITPDQNTMISPYERRNLIPPKVSIEERDRVLFCLCYAKLYTGSKLDSKQTKCVYLGRDPKSDASLVRVLGGKRSGLQIRTAQVVSFDVTQFPYSHEFIPRPKDSRTIVFESDTDEDADSTSSESDFRGSDGADMYSDAADSDSSCSDEEKKEEEVEVKMDEWVPDGNVGSQDGYAIEKIVDHKTKRSRRGRKMKYYKVRWVGDFDDTWRPLSQIAAKDLVDEYERDIDLKVKNLQRSQEESKTQEQHPRRQLVKMVVNAHRSKADRQQKVPQLVVNTKMTAMCADHQPDADAKEINPFADLFDPATQARLPDPRGEKQMQRHKYREYFMQANIKEKIENLGWNTYVEVPRSSVPKGAKILKPVTVYKTKYNARGEIEKFKCRVCLDGSRTKVPESETFEQICGFGIFRLLLCLAARYGLDVVQTDVRNFFLQARLAKGQEYYAEIPEGWAENDPQTHVCKVLAPWYGLKEAAKVSGDQLAECLKEQGLQENPHFPKVYFKWDGDDFHCVGMHIDDGIWITSSVQKLNVILDNIDKKFKLERNYAPTKILGCEFEYDKNRGMMKIHQGSYNTAKVRKNLKGRSYKPARAPGYFPAKVGNPELRKEPTQAPPEEVRQYQKLAGERMWGIQTDGTVAYAMHRAAQHMLNPQPENWNQLKRIQDYVATYPEMGPIWRAANPPEKLKRGASLDCLTFYADADLGGNLNSKSTTGYSAFLGESGIFDWKTKKQTCVSQSSCESETCTNKDATCKAIWYRNGLSVMGFSFTKPTPICQDNRAAIALCESDRHHSRTRHFRLHVNLLRDCYAKRITWYPWIPTKHMRGDLFNKFHQPIDHERLCAINGFSPLPLSELEDKIEPMDLRKYVEDWKREQEEKTRLKLNEENNTN